MNPLDCQVEEDMDGMNMDGIAMKRSSDTVLVKRMDGMDDVPTPECYASNDPCLQTLAWCMHERDQPDFTALLGDSVLEAGWLYLWCRSTHMSRQR
jgi:hypothetical protein